MFASGGSKIGFSRKSLRNLCGSTTSFAISSLLTVLSLVLLPNFADAREPSDSDSQEVIARYLTATQTENQSRAASMEVSIDATIPKLKKEGKLHALRKISELGKITY